MTAGEVVCHSNHLKNSSGLETQVIEVSDVSLPMTIKPSDSTAEKSLFNFIYQVNNPSLSRGLSEDLGRAKVMQRTRKKAASAEEIVQLRS